MTLSSLALPSAEQLRRTLSATLTQWEVLEVSGDQARVQRTPQLDALTSQLDALLGLQWGLEWQLYSIEAAPYTVCAALTLATARREGLAQADTLQAAQQLALAQALRSFGVYDSDEQWVEYDPEEGPNTAELPDLELPAPTAISYGSMPAEAAPVPEPEPDPQMVKAREHIDRLMEELREAGRGKEVARVIVQHGGGYGKDLAQSRAIYKELQALQKS